MAQAPISGTKTFTVMIESGRMPVTQGVVLRSRRHNTAAWTSKDLSSFAGEVPIAWLLLLGACRRRQRLTANRLSFDPKIRRRSREGEQSLLEAQLLEFRQQLATAWEVPPLAEKSELLAEANREHGRSLARLKEAQEAHQLAAQAVREAEQALEAANKIKNESEKMLAEADLMAREIAKAKEELERNVQQEANVGVAGTEANSAGATPATIWQDGCVETASDHMVHSGMVNSNELLHVHVGAGKIGLGLVLKTLASRGEAYVILQRCTSKWKHIIKAGSACIRVNGHVEAKLPVVTDADELKTAFAAIGETKTAKDAEDEGGVLSNGILVLSADPVIMRELVMRATSYSMAVGGNFMERAFDPLARALKQVNAERNPTILPQLYCCENDHDSVNDLRSKLTGCVDVLPVLVDRVCSSVEFLGDSMIDVRTESFDGDVVIPPNTSFSTIPVPFAGTNVHEPSTELGASFLHRKKLLTVNGTHTTLAFLTLVDKEPDTIGPPKSSHELLAFDAFEAVMCSEIDSVGRDCWVWLVARLLMLLTEYNEEIVRHTVAKNTTFGRLRWHEVAATMSDAGAVLEGLLHEARTALQRLSGGGDETARVLGGGIDNRFATRLASVAEYFRACDSFTPLQVGLLEAANVSEVELRSRLERVVRESSRFVTDATSVCNADENRWGLTPKKPKTNKAALPGATMGVEHSPVGVLFDFDGTLANTESPAMEVAFWAIAPYLPSLAESQGNQLFDACRNFVCVNAGRPFEHMIEACDQERLSLGLASIEETRSTRAEPASLLQAIEVQRDLLGLTPVAVMRQQGTEPLTLLEQQKLDTVSHLSRTARECPGVSEALGTLDNMGVPFVIATTSGKPRVPVCVDAAGLRHFFPTDDEDIHSGESDFEPPRFKPAPDVYLRAAASISHAPGNCVAVEDSISGIGSAANAGIGLIVGYVGGQHIAPEMEEAHARELMSGSKSENGRGADIVITHMFDLPMLVESFAQECAQNGGNGGVAGEHTKGWLKNADFSKAAGQLYV
eukprot:TRINITY_DN60358_c0_g1_i1.p1 TRINITY_DN60358_c0_g1~~TRINITY_DN60358_c0_g1_i1.p1  ORF type:complete len:1024 (-),score=172.60 TRINITY_DN60358_c0_g1_i1:119-3190(-)